MKLFISSLQPDVQSFEVPDLSARVDKLTGGVDTTPTAISWFRPYLASDFPELTDVTKDYFFIYSSDHQDEFGSYWGEGNDLALSDFVEKGAMITKFIQDETPFLVRIDGKLCMYNHPTGNPQQTDLHYVTSGTTTSLTNLDQNWTFVDNPLGLHTLANGNQLNGEDESHTGYLIMQYLNGGWLAEHGGGGTDFASSFSRYSSTTDGINFTRLQPNVERKISNQSEFITDTREPFLSSSGVNLVFGRSQPNWTVIGAPASVNQKRICLMKLDSTYREREWIKWIDNDLFCSEFEAFQDGNVVHFYIASSRTAPNTISHATLDISNINNWAI